MPGAGRKQQEPGNLAPERDAQGLRTVRWGRFSYRLDFAFFPRLHDLGKSEAHSHCRIDGRSGKQQTPAVPAPVPPVNHDGVCDRLASFRQADADEVRRGGLRDDDLGVAPDWNIWDEDTACRERSESRPEQFERVLPGKIRNRGRNGVRPPPACQAERQKSHCDDQRRRQEDEQRFARGFHRWRRSPPIP